MPEQPAGRLSAGETGTETETDVSPQCLAAVADPGVDPLFTSRALQPRCGSPAYPFTVLPFRALDWESCPPRNRLLLSRSPGLDTAASYYYLRSLGVLVFWASQEACHRSTPAASDWPSPTTMPPVFIS